LKGKTMSRLRVAVIGVGHLGKEHARILAAMPDVDLVGVADVNPEQARAVAGRCSCRAFTDFWPLLNLVDAAVVAVPTAHHHAIAAEFLRRGIPLLVEKPLAGSLEQADSLVELARTHGALLQVGHIERFNPAYEELCSRPLQPRLVSCERLGPFSGRSTDIGVVLDLMIHDLDILLALARSPVDAVQAVGVSVFGGHEDVASARLTFANGCVANLTASRASPTPMRRMTIWAPEGYVCLDFARRHLTLVQPSQEMRARSLDACQLDPAGLALLKDQLFGRHFQILELDRREGDQLTAELQDFVGCVQTGSRPRIAGEDGRNAIALATRILDSLRAHCWSGRAGGPTGPTHLPAPLGQLFQAKPGEAAA
jgi:predicted dehydrogenase